jgi:hypothetical protein
VAFMHFGRKYSASVPACASCKTRLERQRRLRVVLMAGLGIAAVGVAIGIVGEFGGRPRNWVVATVALLLLCPVIVWQMLFPPEIDITVFATTVHYEFRDPAYAREFARINGYSSGHAS